MNAKGRLGRTKAVLPLAAVFLLAANISEAKYSGGTGEPNNPYRITTPNDLNDIGNHLEDWGAHFVMVNDINMIDYVFNTAVIAPDTDIYHAWYTGTPFTGCFNGDGHVISNLSIVQNTYYLDHVGLFGEIDGGTVENLGVVNISIALGDDSHAAGALASSNKGTIRNCYTSGNIEDGLSSLGGLAGTNSGLIIDSHSSCSVSGRYDCEYLGGLVGGNAGRIERCYATGSVFGNESALIIGGLVGNNPGDLIYCYSSGTVSGWSNAYDIGGLVGRNNGNTCYCYSDAYIGGTSTTENVGGLVGQNYYGKIVNSYTSARIWDYGMNPACVGGLTAKNYFGEIRNCFWNTSTCFVSHGVGSDTDGIIVNLEGITTEQMQQQETFTDGPARWDFLGEVINGRSDDWSMPESVGFPISWWQLDPWPQLPAFSGGDGSKENPFLIMDSNGLNSIGHNSRLMDKYFKMTQNIDCNEIECFVIGSSILPFDGVFDGQGHVVQNLVLNSSESEFIGFFQYLAGNGIIQNFGLENGQIETGTADSVGALAGIVDYGGIIKKCFAKGSLTVGDGSECIGGLVGLNCGAIKYSFTDMSVTAGNNVHALGGLLGRSFSELSNCYSLASVLCGSDAICIGGFAGWCYDSSFSFCYSATAVSAGVSSTHVGGFLGAYQGYPFFDVDMCFWDSDVNPDVNGIGNTTDPNVVNGPNDIWTIHEEVDYPKLVWPLVNFVGWYEVDLLDYAFFAERWGDENCGLSDDCDGVDLDFSNAVDGKDLKIFCDYWLQGAQP
ncbi:MAG: GLUG motif-containing protein [Planctomycetota bacterium]|jgi:hypothetical protein